MRWFFWSFQFFRHFFSVNIFSIYSESTKNKICILFIVGQFLIPHLDFLKTLSLQHRQALLKVKLVSAYFPFFLRMLRIFKRLCRIRKKYLAVFGKYWSVHEEYDKVRVVCGAKSLILPSTYAQEYLKHNSYCCFSDLISPTI